MSPRRSRLMAITGKLQRDGDIVHVIANSVDDFTALLGRLRTESRDFK